MKHMYSTTASKAVKRTKRNALMDRKQRTFFQSAPFRLRRNEDVSRKSFQRSRCETAGQSYTQEHAAKGMTARFETRTSNRFFSGIHVRQVRDVKKYFTANFGSERLALKFWWGLGGGGGGGGDLRPNCLFLFSVKPLELRVHSV